MSGSFSDGNTATAISTNCSSSILHSSNLFPLIPQIPGTNVTLWIEFKTDSNISSQTDVYWSHLSEPSTVYYGKLDRLQNGIFNASLKLVLDSLDKQGVYKVHLCGHVLQIFSVERLCDASCTSQPARVTYINSSLVVPSCAGSVSLLCGLHGCRRKAEVEWSTPADSSFSDRFIRTMEPRSQLFPLNCKFYSRLTIVNGTSKDTNNYTCSVYDSGVTANLTTTLSRLYSYS